MAERNAQTAYRIFSTASLAVGSASATSTAAFGLFTNTIRVVSDTPVRFLVDNAPSVSSTVVAASGAFVPANVVDYFAVSPGQRLSAVAPTTSTAVVTVSEMSA